MTEHLKIHFLLILLGMVPLFSACGGGNGGNTSDPVVDYTGAYSVVLGANEPRFEINIMQTDRAVTFMLDGTNLLVSGVGSVNGTTMILSAEIGTQEHFDAHLMFLDQGMRFEGDWEIAGPNPARGTLTGSYDSWNTYDYDALGAPLFVTHDSIDLNSIEKLSKFRSGIGHDFSDDYEHCRSMKHYFWPKASVDISTIKIFSPVDGVVTGMTEEWDGTLWKGTAVGIEPDNYDAFHITLFHIDLLNPLSIGERVSAGQELGTSEKISGTASDFSVAVNTPTGFRLLSYFRVMADALFQQYQTRGMVLGNDAIITKEQRDADPLSCNGQMFDNGGSLDNWVILN